MNVTIVFALLTLQVIVLIFAWALVIKLLVSFYGKVKK